MKFVKEEVKSASQVVGTPELPVFESFEEAFKWTVENIDFARSDTPGVDKATGKIVDGQAYCLFLINTQNQTNLKNRIRSQFNQKPSKASLLQQAYERFGNFPPEEIVKITKQPGGVQKWAEDQADAALKEFEARRQAAIAANQGAADGSGNGGDEANGSVES